MSNTPFRRANLMTSAIAAIMSQNISAQLQQSAIKSLGEYRSRGHGLGIASYSIKRGPVSSGRYTGVSNGEREMTRRRRQIAAGIIQASA